MNDKESPEQAPEYQSCPTCMGYAALGFDVLAQALARSINRRRLTGEATRAVMDAHMTGVHERHASRKNLAVTGAES